MLSDQPSTRVACDSFCLLPSGMLSLPVIKLSKPLPLRITSHSHLLKTPFFPLQYLSSTSLCPTCSVFLSVPLYHLTVTLADTTRQCTPSFVQTFRLAQSPRDRRHSGRIVFSFTSVQKWLGQYERDDQRIEIHLTNEQVNF